MSQEPWDDEYDESEKDAIQAAADVVESKKNIAYMAQGAGGLSGREVDVLGVAWWKTPKEIEPSLDQLGGRLAKTSRKQVARAWNELVSAVGQVSEDDTTSLPLFLDRLDRALTDDTEILCLLLDGSNPEISPMDTFYGDHLRVAWAAIDQWLAQQGRTEDRTHVAQAALIPAIAMSLKYGPQDPLRGVLAQLPKGDPVQGEPLVFEWLKRINHDQVRHNIYDTLGCLLDHGCDLDATWNGQNIMGAAGTYLKHLTGSNWEDRKDILAHLVERGARWKDQREAMGENAWRWIQGHPAVVAGHLEDVARVTQAERAPAPRHKM